jgi:general secretion pathway protein H
MGCRGFTLIELLVVLAILAALLVVAPPLFSKAVPAVELRGTAREVAASLRAARSHAIATNREATFILDVRSGAYRAEGEGRPRQISPAFAISFLTASSERLDGSEASIRFFPDGGSTGGRVRLERGGRKHDVAVDWFSGRVALVE